jgi:hypothetical protein
LEREVVAKAAGAGGAAVEGAVEEDARVIEDVAVPPVDEQLPHVSRLDAWAEEWARLPRCCRRLPRTLSEELSEYHKSNNSVASGSHKLRERR